MTWQADSNGIFRWSSAFGVNANSARKVDANFGTISALLDAQTAALATHQGDTNNPHSVTKAQVGLGNVLDVAQEPQVPAGNPSQYYRGDKTWDTLDVGAVSGLGSAATHSATDFDPFGAAATVSVTLTAHVSDTNNPHQVTKAQVGLGNVTNVAQEPAIVGGTALQFWRGDKTWQTLNTAIVPESVNLYFTNARALAAVPPAGTGTELQFRNGTAFGAVTGSSVSGSNVTIGGTLSINNTCLIGQNVGFGASTPGITFNGLGVFSNAAILNVISGNTGYLSHRPGGGNNFPQLFVNSMQGSTYFCGFNDSVPLSKFDVNGQLSCYGCNTTLSSLAVPTGLSVTPQGVTGGTAYGYAVTAVNAQGETVASSTVTTATGNATLTSVNKNHLVFNASNGATSYNLYRISGGATQGKIGSMTGTGAAAYTFDDTGLTALGSAPTAPTGTTLIVQAWSGQTADLQQWQASDGTLLARIDNTGALNFALVGISGTSFIKPWNTGGTHRGILLGGGTTNEVASAGGAFRSDVGFNTSTGSTGLMLDGATFSMHRGGVGSGPDFALGDSANTAFQFADVAGAIHGGKFVDIQNSNAAAVALRVKAVNILQGVTTKARTNNVATLTTSIPHRFAVGQTVIVQGIDASFNGSFVIASIPTTTTLTYANTGVDVASVAATGTVNVAQISDLQQWVAADNTILGSVNASGSVNFGSSGFQVQRSTSALTLAARFSWDGVTTYFCGTRSRYDGARGCEFFSGCIGSSNILQPLRFYLGGVDVSGNQQAASVLALAADTTGVYSGVGLPLANTGTFNVQNQTVLNGFVANNTNTQIKTGTIVTGWTGNSATASYTGRISLCGVDFAATREGVRVEADGSTVHVSTYGDFTNYDSSSNIRFKFDANGQLTTYGTNVTQQPLAVPTGLSVTPQGITGATTYGYAVRAVNAQGTTVLSGTVTTATGNATLNNTNFSRLTFNAVNGAASYDIYRITSGGTPATIGKIGNVPGTGAAAYTFDDKGFAGDGTTAAANATGTQFSITGWQRQTTATVVFSAGGGQSGSILELWNATDGAVFTFSSAGQATLKNLKVSGNVGFYNSNATGQQTVTGSRGANAALASLLTSLAATGLIVDSSSA